MASGFLNLPVELIIYILLELTDSDIATFRMVSRASKKAAEQSAALVYKLSCFHAGVFDGSPNAPYTVPQRAQILRTWREARSKGLWTNSPILTPHIPANSTVSVSGTLCASRARDSRSIEFRQFPSRLRGIEAKNWTLNDVGVTEEFVCDPYQDLLVVAEIVGPGNRGRLRFLTCSTGEPHPAAQTDTIEFALSYSAWFIPQSLRLKLCGDIVGVECRPTNSMSPELWVFNWQKGRCLLNVAYDPDDILNAGLEIHGFALLDSRHALITTGGEVSRQSLIVLDCYRTPAHRIIVHEAAYQHAALVLDLPLVQTCLVSFEIYCAPMTPDSKSSHGPGVDVPFRLSDRSPVVLFTTKAFLDDDEIVEPLMFLHVVPSATIYSRLRSDTRGFADIPRAYWQEWEKETLQMDITGNRTMDPPSLFGHTFAMRGSVQRSDGSIRHVVKIYDLRPIPPSVMNSLEVQPDADILISDAPLPHICYAQAGTSHTDDTTGICGSPECDHSECDYDIWEWPMVTGAFVFKTIWTDIDLRDGQRPWLLEDGVMTTRSGDTARIYTL